MGRRMICLGMAVLMLSLSMPGCLSLVVGRELMEGARGAPDVTEIGTRHDLSHTFTSTDASDIQYANQTAVPIDHTVSEIIINFQVQMAYDDEVGGVGVDNFTQGQRYVEAWLYEPGEYPGGSPIWTVRTEKDHPQTRVELSTNFTFAEGEWMLVADAMGYGYDMPIESLSFHDKFTLQVTVIRPCVIFPESPDDCVPLVDLGE